MKALGIRNYNCKDEELSVICRYALSYLKRDLADFAAFSPVFNESYVEKFVEKINFIDELVSPKLETDELKKITARLYSTMDSLLDPVAKIRAYLRLAKGSIGVSAKDFGLTLLTQKIASRDAEGVHQNLLIVVAYLKKYEDALVAVGFDKAIIEQLNSDVSSITDDNQLQFDIVSKRMATVQKNLAVLNDLYSQLTDLLSIGRSMYKTADPQKSKEYVFSSLKKSVRNTKHKKTDTAK
ncbi:MAG: hypothetical protein LBE11_05255 [Prevotellaceae bacterium]|jgi:hypothetical protein|nr:hypothetical protein [Prevotellaceae bacterium]